MKNNFSNKQKILVLVIIIFFLLTLFLIRSRKAEKPTTTLSGQAVSVFRNKKGQVKLVTKNGLTRFKVGEPISLIIVADSNNKDISGFDFLVGYDKTGFTFEKAVSLNANFSLLTFKSADKLTLTGSKKLQVNQKTIFNNSEAVELMFKPIKSGQFSFSILPSSGKEQTQMVDTTSRVFYPRLNNLTVEINQ